MSDSIRETDREESDRDIHELHDPIMREMERPKDGYQPIPLTLIFLFFALIAWGGWYVGMYSGGWRVDVLYPGQGPTEGAERAAEKSDEDLQTLGKRVYSQCASCHQQDGTGVPGSFPPLDGSRWATGAPETPIRIVLHGLEGPIEVAGETYNAAMPAWGDRMSDRQIAAVLTFVRSAWSNEAPGIEPDLVSEIREATADRQQPWTAEELEETSPER